MKLCSQESSKYVSNNRCSSERALIIIESLRLIILADLLPLIHDLPLLTIVVNTRLINSDHLLMKSVQEQTEELVAVLVMVERVEFTD